MYRAVTSFSGVISMAMGEVREISDPLIAEDLLKAGYIMEFEQKKETKPVARPKKGRSK